MKKFVCVLALVIGLATMSSSAFAADLSLRTRADQVISMGEKTVVLHVGGGKVPKDIAIEGTEYKSKFVPLREVFGYTSSTIKWDGKSKIATVANNGKKLLLNFSANPVIPKAGEVVAPRTWIKLQNGQTMIDLYVLTYILHRYGNVNIDGEIYKDTEREEWNKKLDFLGIQYSEWVPELKAGKMHIYVTLP